VVKLDVNGSSVALAAVISANGLVLTKASEIGKGKLTCWLPGGREVGAELLRTDEENDVALVKVDAEGLQPIEWDTDDTVVGQWVVTPGVSETPQAVGIVSVPARKILHRRALVGVVLDMGSAPPKVTEVMNGLGAQKAGIKAGDRILAVNDADVADREDLMKRLRQLREGQTVKLRIQRESERFDASIQMSVPSAELTGFPDRSDRMNRMGSLPSARAEGFGSVIQHDTVLQAWQCGGPLVNLEGKAIGLNIARAGRVATYALPAELVQQIRDRLQAPESGK
jgi:serine protease Do